MKNAIRWILLPFVVILVYVCVHAFTLIGNRGTITHAVGYIPKLTGLLLYGFAEFVAVMFSCTAALKVAPKGKKAVLTAVAIFYLISAVGGLIFIFMGKTNNIIKDIIIQASLLASAIFILVKREELCEETKWY